jgi:hypothetical protein
MIQLFLLSTVLGFLLGAGAAVLRLQVLKR